MDMHGLIKDGLEDYLRGVPGRKLPLEFEEHLRSCEECREEVSWMQEQSRLLRGLAPGRDVEASPGFYARVMERIEAQQGSSIWSALLEPVFGRVLAVASLALVCVFAGYLAINEARIAEQAAAFPSEGAVLMVGEHPQGLGQDRQRDRDTMLVTLATYQR
jgi:anti-sigma factor RsiW